MRLTAGKLRLAGWLIILSIVGLVAFIVVAVSQGINTTMDGTHPDSSFMVKEFPFLLVFAWIFFFVVMAYVLLVFKALLINWFKYTKATTWIHLIIGFGVVSLLTNLIKLSWGATIGATPETWYQTLLWIISYLAYAVLAVLVLKMPGDLFGYRKKIGITGIVAALLGAVGWLAGPTPNAGMASNMLFLISSLITSGFSIYLVVVSIRMFFKAARAVEQAPATA
jgi:hypothetical protein